jgi:hypothetical protein
MITKHLFAALVLLSACIGSDDPTGDESDPSDPMGGQPQNDPGDVTPMPEIARVTIPILRGVDRASAFAVSEARVLHDNHGVRWTGVYIGGPCSGGSGWTKARVEDIANATHWQFMPIYVGQQSSSICGAHHLTYAQGQADGAAAARHMHDFGWARHQDIPVALDVEAGTYFGAESASTSYVRGWVNAVHDRGFRAYVYGSPFALVHYHDAKVRIDGAWAASYFYQGFKKLRPGELDQMGNDFRHRNRAWQYAGNFFVSGAGNVDADTSHFILAPRPGGSNRALITKRNVPATCGMLDIGDGVARGESVASCDGQTVLAMSATGELSLTTAGQTVWTAGTDGSGALAVLQDTGELAVYDDAGDTVFTSYTAGYPEAHATIDAQGLRLFDSDQTMLWTNTDGLLVGQDTQVDLTDSDNLGR